jgi:hypothetical protein
VSGVSAMDGSLTVLKPFEHFAVSVMADVTAGFRATGRGCFKGFLEGLASSNISKSLGAVYSTSY